MLSKADKDALDAQIQQYQDEMEEFAEKTGQYEATDRDGNSWPDFIAWRTAVALEFQAAEMSSSDDEDEEKPSWG